jgi:transposase
VFHYRPGRKGEYAAEILAGFNGTIQVDASGGYSHLATPKRTGGDPLRLAFCWAHGRRTLIKAKPQKGSPIVDEALLRIAALYKVEDAIRGSDPDHRRTVRQELSRPLVDAFFAWLKAQAARVSRKSDLGEAMAYMLKRQDGFRCRGLTRRHWRHGPPPSSTMVASTSTPTWWKTPSAARP